MVVDINKAKIVYGNSGFIDVIPTAIDRTCYFKLLAEALQKRYMSGKHRA